MQMDAEGQLVLERIPFLASAGADVLTEFLSKSVRTRLHPGTFIRMEGDACTNFALVLEGTARVYKSGESGREITLYRIHPGESCVLTASCIVGGREFPAFAVAETDLDVVVIPASDFRRWVSQYDEWREYVFGLVSRRLASVIEVVEEVAFRRLDARVAGYLDHTADGEPLRVVATHEQIADELGSSREVISRILKEFEREDIVSLARGEIMVLSRPLLRRRAEQYAV